jgi:hypothetical protein
MVNTKWWHKHGNLTLWLVCVMHMLVLWAKSMISHGFGVYLTPAPRICVALEVYVLLMMCSPFSSTGLWSILNFYTIFLINSYQSLVDWLLGGSGYYVFFMFLLFLQFLPWWVVVLMDSRGWVAEKVIYHPWSLPCSTASCCDVVPSPCVCVVEHAPHLVSCLYCSLLELVWAMDHLGLVDIISPIQISLLTCHLA